MAELFLIRHAQSWNNAEGEAKRVSDPPLTDIGRLQAERVERAIAQIPAQHYFVSGFRRALETAAPFANKHQRDFQVWRDIHEVGGCYEGQSGQEKRAVPGMDPTTIRQHFSWAVPEPDWNQGGWNQMAQHETVEAALPRVKRLADQLQQQFQDPRQTIVMVSHGEFISLLLGQLLGHGDPFFVRPRSIYNTAITQVQLNGPKVKLIEFNRVCHLDQGPLTS